MHLHTFAKMDGSNLRFEWSKKRGWYKAGTRTRLLDEHDPIFGQAPSLFKENLADFCEKVAVDNRWDRVVVFCEFWGAESLAGRHKTGDRMNLTVIDVALHKKGILPPKEFLKLFDEVGPYYLGYVNWNAEFLQQVRDGEIDRMSFEGVIGKGTTGKKGKEIVMRKFKTKRWIDAVIELYGEKEGRRIVSS
jgi:hypothetical protein